MEMTLVEKVARAINPDAWFDGAPIQAQHKLREIARDAIAAMRDCTPAMLDAGSAAHPVGGYVRGTLLTDIIEAEWVAMCDAALGEK
jgi:hypothetical protein